VLATSGCPKKPGAPEASSQSPDPAIFSYNDKTYTRADLPDKQRMAYYEAERRFNREMEKISEELVLAEFQKTKDEGDHPEAKKTAEPTEAEMKKFYEENKAKIPYPYDMVKKELRDVIMQERNHKKQTDQIGKAKAAGNFKFLLPQPQLPRVTVNTADRPVKGNPEAKITVVEFADFRCPHCGEAFKDLTTVFPKYKDKVKFVFMDYPLQPEGPSKNISMGAFCAHKQGKFWEYHDAAFQDQAALTVASPGKIAGDLKLEKEAFDKCLAAADTAAAVVASRAEGVRVGVNATPTFFVNGSRVDADHGLKELQAAIDSELGRL